MPAKNTCPFCNLAGEEILVEKSRVVALVDPYPVTSGHALVIPKRHVTRLSDLDEREILQIFECVTVLQSTLSTADGFNVGFNQGRAAGQSIPHLHCHVIPREEGDVDNPQGGVRAVIPKRQHYSQSRHPKP